MALTPWEEKELYRAVLRSEDHQKELLRKASALESNSEAQITEAITSRERMEEAIDDLGSRIEDGLEGGFAQLDAAFTLGMSEIAWQLELNRTVLQEVVRQLSAPLDAQAKELRQRAENAYRNGLQYGDEEWFDDAIKDFQESEKRNRYDFTIHMNLGLILLFQKQDAIAALPYFEKAVRYAKPVSAYYASVALILKSRVLTYLGRLDQAQEASSEAAYITPAFCMAIYENAVVSARLNHCSQAISLLEQAIRCNIDYADKSVNDGVFERCNASSLYRKLLDEQESLAKAAWPGVKGRYLALAAMAARAIKELSIQSPDHPPLQDTVARVDELIRRHSFRDYFEANRLIDTIAQKVNEEFLNLNREIERRSESLPGEIKEVVSLHTRKAINSRDRLARAVGRLGTVLAAIFGVLAYRAASQDKISALMEAAFEVLFLTVVVWVLVMIAAEILKMKPPTEALERKMAVAKEMLAEIRVYIPSEIYRSLEDGRARSQDELPAKRYRPLLLALFLAVASIVLGGIFYTKEWRKGNATPETAQVQGAERSIPRKDTGRESHRSSREDTRAKLEEERRKLEEEQAAAENKARDQREAQRLEEQARARHLAEAREIYNQELKTARDKLDEEMKSARLEYDAAMAAARQSGILGSSVSALAKQRYDKARLDARNHYEQAKNAARQRYDAAREMAR